MPRNTPRKTRVCPGCGVRRNIKKQFHRDSTSASGRRSHCTICRKKYLAKLATREPVEVTHKTCRTCKDEQEIKEFSKDSRSPDGKSYRCRTCHQDKAAAYRATEHGKEVRRRCNRDFLQKSRSTPEGKLRRLVSKEIRRSLKKEGKPGIHAVWDAITYTPEELRNHLEAQFEEGMTWANHGIFGWHIDHIVAHSQFKYATLQDPDLNLCWALDNLQPMWAKENLKKGTRSMEEYYERKKNERPKN